MKLFNLRNYIYDNDLNIIIKNNYINIINFEKIMDITDKQIVVKDNNKIVQINGNNLLLNKMFMDEILVKGNIDNIKFINE